MSRALAAWMMALYAAATVGQAVPALFSTETVDHSATVMTGPSCCPLWCSLAGPIHHLPAQAPADCDLCKQIIPVSAAIHAAQLATPASPAPGPLPGHAASGHAAGWRGPASPRDPPLPS